MDYEVNLAINLLPFLTDYSLTLWLSKIELHINQNLKNNDLKQTFIKIYTNHAWILLHEGHSNNLTTVKMFLHEIDKLVQGTQLYYEINTLFFLKGLYLIAQGNYQEGLQAAEKSIEQMYYFNDDHTARAHSKALNEFIDNWK